jgi:peptidoglycan/LPS O-acetylase OafA/YrhL
LLVVVFHVCETYALDDPFKQVINHGYLAVDFFFLLSGFVIAYAYDDRWVGMSQWEFYKRRLIRLQPMVVMGTLIGAALYFQQSGPLFPLMPAPAWKVLLVMIVGFTLLPLPPSADIRGWQEMHPLNGPAWSLFYEYIGNIAYAVLVRRFSNLLLGLFVFAAALLLIQVAVFGGRGDLIGGWALNASGLHIGFARLLFPFFAGVLLIRIGRRIAVNGAFAICSVLLVIALSLPRFGDAGHAWVNGLYEALCVIVVFPLIVAIGAGEKLATGTSIKIARIFGDLSYPLYITHYPLIYLYSGWIYRDKVPPSVGAPVGVVVVAASVAMAYACSRFYDLPVRRLLAAKFLPATRS